MLRTYMEFDVRVLLGSRAIVLRQSNLSNRPNLTTVGMHYYKAARLSLLNRLQKELFLTVALHGRLHTFH